MILAKFDVEKLKELGAGLHQLSSAGTTASRLALNKTLDWVFTRVVRKVAETSGIQQKRVRLIIRKKPAQAGQLVAKLTARGGFTSLKDFRPRQTKKGVSASPWGKRHVFPHTFIGPNGHVFVRTGKGRLPLKRLSGPAIPKEMVKDKEIQPIITDGMEHQFPKSLEFFYDREVDRAKERFGL